MTTGILKGKSSQEKKWLEEQLDLKADEKRRVRSITPKPLTIPKWTVDEVLRSVCRESFYEFFKEMWECLSQDELVDNWHIKYLCDELQLIAERMFQGKPREYDLVINIPPGTTKSSIVSEAFPAWVWTRMPHYRFLCASYAHPLALDLARRCRDIIISEKYQRLFDIPLRSDMSSKSSFGNRFNGMRNGVGVGGTTTGMHGHFLLIDDPINAEDAKSDVNLKSTNTWMKETIGSRRIDKVRSVLILVMQRLHQNDPAGERIARAAKDGSIKHICLPAEISPLVQPPELKERYIDGLLDPVRLSRVALRDQRAELGEYGYAGQFMQDPIPAGGGMFKPAMIQIVDGMPKFKEFKHLVRYWDKAGTGGGGAFTVGVLMGKDFQDRYWILDVIRGQWDSATRERKILQTAHRDGFKVIVATEQEPGSGGKESAEATGRMLAGFRFRKDVPKGDKVTRADVFSTQVNNSNVLMVKGYWNKEYLEEMKYFPFSRYKDQIDASSGAFAILSKRRVRIGTLDSYER